jgi:hypothetical protein
LNTKIGCVFFLIDFYKSPFRSHERLFCSNERLFHFFQTAFCKNGVRAACTDTHFYRPERLTKDIFSAKTAADAKFWFDYMSLKNNQIRACNNFICLKIWYLCKKSTNLAN